MYYKGGLAMQSKDMQDLLLRLIPHWHCFVAKPFKNALEKGLSLDMYCCVRILQEKRRRCSMTAIAKRMHMSKQQMTKLVDGLAEQGLVERKADSGDRRIMHLQVTQKAKSRINRLFSEESAYFRALYEQIPPEDRDRFCEALQTLDDVFTSVASAQNTERKKAK